MYNTAFLIQKSRPVKKRLLLRVIRDQWLLTVELLTNLQMEHLDRRRSILRRVEAQDGTSRCAETPPRWIAFKN